MQKIQQKNPTTTKKNIHIYSLNNLTVGDFRCKLTNIDIKAKNGSFLGKKYWIKHNTRFTLELRFKTKRQRLVTMVILLAPAGLSRCFNEACWWMTLLLYSTCCVTSSSILHLHMLPVRGCSLIVSTEGYKYDFKKQQVNKTYCLRGKNFLLTKEELDCSKWLSDKANNVDRSDTHPQHEAPTLHPAAGANLESAL